ITVRPPTMGSAIRGRTYSIMPPNTRGIQGISTQGIWVDSVSCPASGFLGTNRFSLQMRFEGVYPGVYRVHTSSSPLTSTFTELTSQLLPYMIIDGQPAHVTTAPLQNSWTGGASMTDGLATVSLTPPPPVCTFSGTDTSLGFSLDTLVSNSPDDDAGY